MNVSTSNVSFRINTDIKNHTDRFFYELDAETVVSLPEAERIGRDPRLLWMF
jgi:hypothetical protein